MWPTCPPESEKTPLRYSLELEPTPDILAEIGRRKQDQILIGFAAETENLVPEARRKLESKNCDMVVANLVSQDGTGSNPKRTKWFWSSERVRTCASPRRRSA